MERWDKEKSMQNEYCVVVRLNSCVSESCVEVSECGGVGCGDM